MNRPVPRFLLLPVIPLLLLSACAAPVSGARRFKILVLADGFYRLTGAQLEAAGIAMNSIDPSTLQLFHGDREIAVRTRGEKSQLVVDFYGQASQSPYSAWNVYWLTFGNAKGKRILDRASAPSEQNPSTSFQSNVRFERPTLFIPQPGELADSWYWQAMTAPITTSIPLTLPFALAAPARLRVDLFGASQDKVNPDHHLRVLLNNTLIADETWDGQGKHSISAEPPATAVKSESNSLQLVSPGDTKAVADAVLLRSVEITYTRRLAAQQEALAFKAGQGSYRLEGFAQEPIDLFDITDPAAPVRISDAISSNSALVFGTTDSAERRWMAVGQTGYQPVSRLVPMYSEDLASKARGADYLIITHPDFVESLRPLVEWRSKRGLHVFVATTDEIYDAYNYGAESPQALRTFLRAVSPRYVLLVGKASYDYRDFVQGPNKNLVPTFLLDTLSLGQVGSDNWYAANSDTDAHPKSAIGRIPAKTRQQVALAVNKIIAYESGARGQVWRERALFVADDDDKAFTAVSDELAAQISPRVGAEKVYLDSYSGDVSAARADLVKRWNGGSLLLTYVGHGSLDTWAEGPLFSTEEIDQVRNGDRLPVLFTPTCLDGFFYHPEKDSLAEELLFKNQGGIIAGIVPTGFSITEAQAALMRSLFRELFRDAAPSLGEALARAKQQLPTDAPEMREVIETFVLLGDPAIEIGNWP